MSEGVSKKLGNVIQFDEEQIRQHLGNLVRGTLEEPLNKLLDPEAEQICNAPSYERYEARKDNPMITSPVAFQSLQNGRICLSVLVPTDIPE